MPSHRVLPPQWKKRPPQDPTILFQNADWDTARAHATHYFESVHRVVHEKMHQRWVVRIFPPAFGVPGIEIELRRRATNTTREIVRSATGTLYCAQIKRAEFSEATASLRTIMQVLQPVNMKLVCLLPVNKAELTSMLLFRISIDDYRAFQMRKGRVKKKTETRAHL